MAAFPDWLTNVLTSIFVAVVTAIVTVRLSLRQFRSQRWWERKEAAYSQLVDALHHLQRYTNTLARNLGGERFTDEHIERLKSQHETAYDELYRLTNTGTFLISENAAAILAELDERDRSSTRWSPDFFEEQARAFKQALVAIRAEAKRDLKVE